MGYQPLTEWDVHPSRDPKPASVLVSWVGFMLIQVMQVIQVLDCEKSQRIESYWIGESLKFFIKVFRWMVNGKVVLGHHETSANDIWP